MFNDEFDYFPEPQRNMRFEKPPHGPSRGPPAHMRGPPGMRRRMMPGDGGGPPPNYRGPRGEPMFENEFSQPHGIPPMGMGGPQNMPRGPPGHFSGNQHMGGPNPQFGSRQPQPGMPGKGHFQRPPMVPPFGLPPPGFPSGGPPHPQNRNPQTSNHASPTVSSPNPNVPNIDLSGELWVETKAGDGKVYYYNARTREAVWTKPDHVKVLNQEQIEAMAAAAAPSNTPDSAPQKNDNPKSNSQINPATTTPNQYFVPMAPMPGMGPMPAPNMGMMPYGLPPPPFAMPPPGMVAGPGYPFMPPPAFSTVMGVPAPTPPTTADSTVVTSVSSDSKLENDTSNSNSAPATEIKNKNEWVEYKAKDGRSYFYNSLTGQSVWDKPPGLDANEVNNENKTTFSASEAEGSDIVISEAQSVSDIASSQAMEVDDSFVTQNESKIDNSEVPESETPERTDIRENGTDPTHNIEAEKDREREMVHPDDGSSVLMQEEPTSTVSDEQESSTQKTVDKTRPVSSTPIGGSPWCIVWTGDQRVFFFNPSSHKSVWQKPAELKGRADVEKLIQCPPPYADTTTPKEADKTESESAPESKKIKLETNVDDEKAAKVKNTEASKNNINPGKQSAIDAELAAAKERASISLDVRMKQFRELLIEKNVSAFSTWEKELHKIVFDPRYLLITSRERKQVFEKHVKDHAEAERNEKRKKMREHKEHFRKLLEEASLTAKSTFSEFAQRFGKDDRFKAIDKMREKESLFNDFLQDLRRREKDERSSLREKTKKGFLELLKEQKGLDKNSRYSDVKKALSEDPRYKAVDSSTLREELFKEYIGATFSKGSSRDNEDDVAKEREKQERVEASIREREKEVQRTLSTHLRERDKERELHKHDEAVQHFKALLTDLVRTPDVSFHEVKKTLRKDHRWEIVGALNRDERERVFEEHIGLLYRKKKEKFRELLDETSEITLTSTWKEIKKLIKDDPRCSKFSSSDRRCEKEFKEYLKDRMVAAKADFRELLKETKIITYKSRKLIEESDHLNDIEKVLQNDKRYLVLQCIEDERTELLMSYIDTLDRKGPPPPPTASEPSRRSTK